MLFQIDQELQESRHDLSAILNGTSNVFASLSDSQLTRQRRGAGVGLAALAAVSLFGGGVAMGNSNSCGLRGMFGGCQDEAAANAENIRRASGRPDTIFYGIFYGHSRKKFLAQNEMAALNAIQAEMNPKPQLSHYPRTI